MVDLFSVHRADDANVIGDLGNLRQDGADFLSGFSDLRERKLRSETIQWLALELCDLLAFGVRLRHWFPAHFCQLRLVIQGLEMRWSACHAKKDHPFGLGSEMGRIQYTAPFFRLRFRHCLGS